MFNDLENNEFNSNTEEEIERLLELYNKILNGMDNT